MLAVHLFPCAQNESAGEVDPKRGTQKVATVPLARKLFDMTSKPKFVILATALSAGLVAAVAVAGATVTPEAPVSSPAEVPAPPHAPKPINPSTDTPTVEPAPEREPMDLAPMSAAPRINASNNAYLTRAAKSLGGADAKAAKLKDGTLWRSHRDGIVVYSNKRLALTVRNAMAQAWADTGWENGRFGYPTGEQYRSGADTRQKFTGGIIGVRPNGTSYWLPPEQKLPDFTVTGSGWGHGVGMSQHGARAMSAEGRNATQILEHYYNPAKVSDSKTAAAGDIRVQLLKSGTSQMSVHGGRMRVIDPTAKKTYTAPAGSSLTLSRSGSQLSYVLKTPEGFDVVPRDKNNDGTPDKNPRPEANKVTGKIRIQWEGTRAWPAGSQSTVSIPGTNAESKAPGTYRHGELEAGILGNQVNLVTSLRLNDEYLYGLSEVPSSWPSPVLQAQAVAGRTYAMRKTALKPSCDCNVTDEVQDQKFTGWAKENEQPGYGAKWKAAVDATLTRNAARVPTSGSVVMHAGRLAETLYSSSTGGATRDSGDVWGGVTQPYLRSRPDPWSLKPAANNPYAQWSQGTSQRDMARVFGLSDVVSVKIDRAKDLTLTSATATSSSGTKKTLSGNTFRGATSGVGARSAWISAVKPSVVIKSGTNINPRNFCTATVKPGASLGTAVSKNRDGAVICLSAGTHKPSKVSLKWRQTMVGHTRANTRLDGTISVKTKKSGKLHRIATSKVPAKAPTKFACTTGNPCNTAQILFSNGKPLTRVNSKAKVKSGTYWVDHRGRAIFTGKASSAKTKYTLAATPRSINLGTWSRAGNIHVTGYAAPANTGALWLRGAHSTLFSGQATNNHGIGVQTNGHATAVLNSIIRHNGQVGISFSGGKNQVVLGSEISKNGWAGFRPATFTGGIAASNKATVKVSKSKILDNLSAGTRGVRTKNGAKVSVSSSTVRGNR